MKPMLNLDGKATMPSKIALRYSFGKTTTLIVAVSMFFAGCSKKQLSETNLETTGTKEESASVSAPCTTCYVAGTNQNGNRIEVYDPAVADWNTAAAKIWSWKPTTTLAYTSTDIAAWSNVSDVKLRDNTLWANVNQVIVATSSGGLITIASYPYGYKKWARNVGGNPHSAELLPNGNIATASSTGGYVRVYASSQSSTNNTYAQFNLPDAHGVLWDPANNLLWALGDNLYALTVGGTAANPTLTEVTSRRKTITGTGHDLSPYYGDSNKLLITASSYVWVYDKTTKVLTNVPGAAFRTAVKAISNQPSTGQLVETKPRTSCTQNTWCTAYVEFYNGTTGALEMTKYVSGAAFYKARIFNSAYQ
ncbi:MAG: DUF6528 family protein [Sphingobacteriaceae bacterium]